MYALFTAVVCLFISNVYALWFFYILKLAVASGSASFLSIQLNNQDPFSLHLHILPCHIKAQANNRLFLFSGMVAALGNLYIVCSICVFALKLSDNVVAVIY